jgi:hypothetical protein
MTLLYGRQSDPPARRNFGKGLATRTGEPPHLSPEGNVSRPVEERRPEVEEVECVLEDGARFGPLELLAREGKHVIVQFGEGTVFPLPARAIATKAKRRSGSSSGERAAAAPGR